jgi:hypothetical protein
VIRQQVSRGPRRDADQRRARFLYQESFEFPPQWQLWLAANHAIRLRAIIGSAIPPRTVEGAACFLGPRRGLMDEVL